MKIYDVIIIGAGPVGLASALALSKRNLSVLVIEQYNLLNQMSSSSGATRQFRLQYSEEYMTKLCLDSVPYWEGLQSQSSEMLRSKVGSLWFGIPESNSSEGQIKEAIKTMDKFGITYTKLDKKNIEDTYAFKNLPEDFVGFFQPDGGTINVSGTINTLKRLCDATRLVEFTFNEAVVDIDTGDEIKIVTKTKVFYSKKLVMCAGPYINRLLLKEGIQLQYDIWQMVSTYFKLNDLAKDLPSWFVYEKGMLTDQGFYYGFENCAWDHPGYLRIAPAFTNSKLGDPIQKNSNPSPDDLQLTVNWVKKRLSFVDPSPVFTSTCLASIPIDEHKKMYLDFLTKDNMINKNVVLLSSGWAFKLVPLLGKICADLIVNGHTPHNISHFGISEKPQKNLFTTQSKRRLPF